MALLPGSRRNAGPSARGAISGISAAEGRLREHQRQFAAALLDPSRPVPAGLVGPDGQHSKKRFDVYRNNVVTGLVEALKAAFPAVCRIVGDEFFMAMARIYAALEPPRSPVMLDYGATFADFIARFEPANCVPYLADVARLERAWTEAYHAAEAPPADPAQLAGVASRTLAQLSLTLHPTLRVTRSPYPVVRIWQMNVERIVPASIDLGHDGENSENALVIRPTADVEVRCLPAGAASFIQRLAAGDPVADAATRAFEADPAFDLSGALHDLFAVGAIVGWRSRVDSRCSLSRGADESS